MITYTNNFRDRTWTATDNVTGQSATAATKEKAAAILGVAQTINKDDINGRIEQLDQEHNS